jgi:hypothetical protein
MNVELQIAVITACSAIAGSVVGGLVTFLTTRHLKSQEWRQEQLVRELSKREELYSDFLTECGKLSLRSIDTDLEAATEFAHHHALLGRIRLVSTQNVASAAEVLAKVVVDIFRPKGSESLSKAGVTFFEAQSKFCEACRFELEELKRTA